NAKVIRHAALLTSTLTFIGSLWIFSAFVGHTYHFQLVEYVPWIDSLGIHYRMGIDGISIWLYLLTTLLSVISIGFSYYVKERVKAYMVAMLILETAMLVVMISLAMLNRDVSGQISFNIVDIQANVANGKLWAGALGAQAWIFWAF